MGAFTNIGQAVTGKEMNHHIRRHPRQNASVLGEVESAQRRGAKSWRTFLHVEHQKPSTWRTYPEVPTIRAEERGKGIDKVMAILPRLLRAVPNTVYLIAGDGTEHHSQQNSNGTIAHQWIGSGF